MYAFLKIHRLFSIFFGNVLNLPLEFDFPMDWSEIYATEALYKV